MKSYIPFFLCLFFSIYAFKITIGNTLDSAQTKVLQTKDAKLIEDTAKAETVFKKAEPIIVNTITTAIPELQPFSIGIGSAISGLFIGICAWLVKWRKRVNQRKIQTEALKK